MLSLTLPFLFNDFLHFFFPGIVHVVLCSEFTYAVLNISFSGYDTERYSLNKQRRWLLAENLRNFICAENVHEDFDFKVILVEREQDIDELRQSDCIRVCETKSACAEILPKDKRHFLDLRHIIKKPDDKIKCSRTEENLSSDKEEIELYYEICYAQPQCKLQWMRECGRRNNVCGPKCWYCYKSEFD